jgi:hypothetical protein
MMAVQASINPEYWRCVNRTCSIIVTSTRVQAIEEAFGALRRWFLDWGYAN